MMENLRKIYSVMENDGEMYFIEATKNDKITTLIKKEDKKELNEPFGHHLLILDDNSTIEDTMVYYMTKCNKYIVDFFEIRQF